MVLAERRCGAELHACLNILPGKAARLCNSHAAVLRRGCRRCRALGRCKRGGSRRARPRARVCVRRRRGGRRSGGRGGHRSGGCRSGRFDTQARVQGRLRAARASARLCARRRARLAQHAQLRHPALPQRRQTSGHPGRVCASHAGFAPHALPRRPVSQPSNPRAQRPLSSSPLTTVAEYFCSNNPSFRELRGPRARSLSSDARCLASGRHSAARLRPPAADGLPAGGVGAGSARTGSEAGAPAAPGVPARHAAPPPPFSCAHRASTWAFFAAARGSGRGASWAARARSEAPVRGAKRVHIDGSTAPACAAVRLQRIQRDSDICISPATHHCPAVLHVKQLTSAECNTLVTVLTPRSNRDL